MTEPGTSSANEISLLGNMHMHAATQWLLLLDFAASCLSYARPRLLQRVEPRRWVSNVRQKVSIFYLWVFHRLAFASLRDC